MSIFTSVVVADVITGPGNPKTAAVKAVFPVLKALTDCVKSVLVPKKV
jgi:hypothetical protein